MSVKYNGKKYNVTKNHSSTCDGTRKGTFFYHHKSDTLSSTDSSGYVRIGLRAVSLIALILALTNMWKLKYLRKTNPDGSYWCDTYKIPEPVRKAFPMYSDKWSEAFLYDKAEDVQGAAADVSGAVADSTGGGLLGNVVGITAKATEYTARAKQRHAQFKMFSHDTAAGAQLLYRVHDGIKATKEGTLKNWIENLNDYTSSKWWTFLRTRMLIVLVSAVVLTFVIDTIIDQVWTVSSIEQKIGSLVGSLCIALLISTNMLTLHTYKTRESAQRLMTICAEQGLLGETTSQDLERIFQTEWTKLDILRIIL
jgi:hypothetical protein